MLKALNQDFFFFPLYQSVFNIPNPAQKGENKVIAVEKSADDK